MLFTPQEALRRVNLWNHTPSLHVHRGINGTVLTLLRNHDTVQVTVGPVHVQVRCLNLLSLISDSS